MKKSFLSYTLLITTFGLMSCGSGNIFINADSFSIMESPASSRLYLPKGKEEERQIHIISYEIYKISSNHMFKKRIFLLVFKSFTINRLWL